MRIITTRGDREGTRTGVYVGGIGPGGFEVRPDGTFARCTIWNEWSDETPLEAFFVHLDARGVKRVLRLDDYSYSHGAVPGVSCIDYRGEFPKVSLVFPEAGVKVEYTSFFVPGNVRDSSLPAVLVRVKGKGRLVFLLRNRESSGARVTKKAVFLDGNGGTIGLESVRGKPFAISRAHESWTVTFLNKWENANPFPGPTMEGGLQDCGLHWEGGFDDEFVICWHYPRMLSKWGKPIGHWYANRFKSCDAVMRYVMANRRRMAAASGRLHRSIFGSNAPGFLKDAYSSQLSCIPKMSWFTKRGEFGVWEGSCLCCGLQTTDVAYYGSWLYSSLFPALERSGISLTAKFQRRNDGWIPHSFYDNFGRIDEYRRKDMNMQFVLMVLRDFLQWRDRRFLGKLYPNVKRAILGAWVWDIDGDGLPEIEGTAQTFDQWKFNGTSSYIASLWLAALRGAALLARQAGDRPFALKCEGAFPRARAAMFRKLWNGSYFSLAHDGKRRDDCCLLDALSGDWFMRALGLGGVLPDGFVRSHLRACLRLNRKRFDPSYMKQYSVPGERGWCYINGGYRDDRRIGFQQYESWTGIEYAFAVHLYLMGMKREAMRVVRDVHERRVSSGTVWNHQECGGDYYRAMMVGAFWELVRGELPPRRRG